MLAHAAVDSLLGGGGASSSGATPPPPAQQLQQPQQQAVPVTPGDPIEQQLQSRGGLDASALDLELLPQLDPAAIEHMIDAPTPGALAPPCGSLSPRVDALQTSSL